MPNDLASGQGSVEPLIASGAVSHTLETTGLEEAQETAFLKAVCEVVPGSIYRADPFKYFFQADEDGSGEADTLLETLRNTLEERFSEAQTLIESLSPVEATDAQTTASQNLNASVRSGALTYMQSGDSDVANAIVMSDFAVRVAQQTAEGLANIALEQQETAILDRLAEFETRFQEMEERISGNQQLDIREELSAMSQALENHAERLESNLTQDRLDTLIALVMSSQNEPDAQGAAPTNERLTIAVETLLEAMQTSPAPDATLLDPYFEQLQRQCDSLANVVDALTKAGNETGTIGSQVTALKDMASSAAEEGALTAAEKIESLGDISSGVSSLTHRVATAAKASEEEARQEPDTTATTASDPAPTNDEIEPGAEAADNSDQEPTKLSFEDVEAPDEEFELEALAQETAPEADDTPLPQAVASEEELDRRVEELLRAPKVNATDPVEMTRQLG